MISQQAQRQHTTQVRNIIPMDVIPVEPYGIGDYFGTSRIKIKGDIVNFTRRLSSARDWVERRTGRVLVQSTFDQIVDEPPLWDYAIELRKPPIRKVVSITINDTYQNQVVVDPSVYTLSFVNDPYVRIMLAYAAVWPQPYRSFESMRIRTINGYATFVTSINTSTGDFLAPGHLYNSGDQLRISIGASGSTVPALPTNFFPGIRYFIVNAIPLISVQLSKTFGGPAILPGDQGIGNVFLGEIPGNLTNAVLTLAASELFSAELSEEGKINEEQIPGQVLMWTRGYERLRM